eukprot:CAMPEP_0171060392 /NCGR_PEP_ID=MMETSP0766_2-20121228/3811_1 /TAXON_ID=439317 /ORGANISM="Gambierdiscus australes, Strain CAWD 149" /LENGTH=67 /DNA_ID=CAMNT_0011515969 /DNA_START=120 /DNA_END=323 /DNA_ORIENTATION=+
MLDWMRCHDTFVTRTRAVCQLPSFSQAPTVELQVITSGWTTARHISPRKSKALSHTWPVLQAPMAAL